MQTFLRGLPLNTLPKMILNYEGLDVNDETDPFPNTPIGTDANTSQKTLGTYTLPGGTIPNGGGIHIHYMVSFAANANNKGVNFFVNDLDLVINFDNMQNLNDKSAIVDIYILKINDTDGAFWGRSTIIDGNSADKSDVTTPAEELSELRITEDGQNIDWTTDLEIKVTGTNGTASANDIRRHSFIVKSF